MKAWMVRVGCALLLFGWGQSSVSYAETAVRSLPTLLIKGTVESLNTSEEGKLILKVKDRYGFETPIYLEDSVRISQDGQEKLASDLKQGANVEVEYNFDVNTAKRQGVVVTITDALPAVEVVEPESVTESPKVQPESVQKAVEPVVEAVPEMVDTPKEEPVPAEPSE